MFVNYPGSYLNWGGNAGSGNSAWNVIRNGLYPVGGGQPVSSSTTVDLHVAYDFKGEGALAGTQVFFDAANLFDEDPPFYNGPTGYDFLSGNLLGRQVTLGVTKKW